MDSVIAAQFGRWSSWAERISGPQPFVTPPDAVDSGAVDLLFQNSVMVFGYALARAAAGREIVSMLDWGSGLGHYYLLARELLPESRIEYDGRDLPRVTAEAGRLLPNCRFSSDQDLGEGSYDLVLSSSSLQYSEDWQADLDRLCRASSRFLLVTGLPTVREAGSFTFVQRPYRYGYDTEYLAWCLNSNALLQQARESGCTLVREFELGHQPPIVGAPEQCSFRGFLFRPVDEDGRR